MVLEEHELERLMNEYGDAVLRMCYLYLKDYYLAEDAAQETFFKALKSYHMFEHRSSEKTWLTRIAVNCCKNIMRTHWFQIMKNNFNDDMRIQEGDPFDDYLEKESISGAIMRLSMSDRQIIVLYYYQELSVKEIAAVIGRSENTALQRLNRARGRLRKILTEDGYEGHEYKEYD